MLLSLVAVAVVAVSLYLHLSSSPVRPSSSIHLQQAVDKVRLCRQIISFRRVDKNLAGDLSHRLRSRAEPNYRLVRAFGIINSFTSDDVAVHHTFMAKERELLKNIVANDWTRQHNAARAFLRLEVSQAALSRGPLRLAPCVRNLCLRAVLEILLKVDVKDVSNHVFTTVTEEINVQWQRSKTDDGVTESSLLNYSLDEIFRGSQFVSKTGLELVMPAYETLWRSVLSNCPLFWLTCACFRVVLLTFISAFVVDEDVSDSCRCLLERVPACLGTRSREEKQARLVAKVGFIFYIQFRMHVC